jgi:serpin B
MKRLLIISTILLTITFSNAQQNSSIESIGAFSFKILEQINSETENCFYSPFSIFGALSMTYAGAKENTKNEMEKVLELTDNEKIHQDYKKLSDAASLERELTILSSNSLWIQKSLKPEKKYLELTQQYNAKIERVSFSDENDREKARKQMNEWVEKQTKGNILNFIPKGILDESTILLIINAIYFNASWNNEFPVDGTMSEIFLSSAKDSVQCKMMNTFIESNYYEDEMMQVVEILYQNNKASMIVFLPKKEITINNENFNYSYFKKVLGKLENRNINLALPKFKIESNYELSESLQKMGMKSAFSPGADFSGISGSKNLKIDKILHRSIIDVSEKGTEAASSTAVISTRSTKIAKEPVEFKANRPFYFIIKQNPGNLILFMGHLVKPIETVTIKTKP